MGSIKQGKLNMISQLIERAAKKAGSQNKLAEKIGLTSGRISEFKNYKTGDPRKPPDELILTLADMLGLDKAETLYKAKLETEPEKAKLWEFLVRSAGLEPTPQASEAYRHIPAGIFIILIIKYIYKSITYNNNARGHFTKCYLTPKIPIYQIRR